MHNDRVLARIVGYDRRGRPEGHIVEVHGPREQADHRPAHQRERRAHPRAGRQAHRPRHPHHAEREEGEGRAGGVGRAHRFSQPPFAAARPRGRSDRRYRRSGHGNRDRGAQVRRAARVLRGRARAGRETARRSARRRTSAIAWTCATCRSSRSTARTRATSTTPSIASR